MGTFIGLKVSISIIIGNSKGLKNQQKITKTAFLGIVISVLLASVFLLLLISFSDMILHE